MRSEAQLTSLPPCENIDAAPSEGKSPLIDSKGYFCLYSQPLWRLWCSQIFVSQLSACRKCCTSEFFKCDEPGNRNISEKLSASLNSTWWWSYYHSTWLPNTKTKQEIGSSYAKSTVWKRYFSISIFSLKYAWTGCLVFSLLLWCHKGVNYNNPLTGTAETWILV